MGRNTWPVFSSFGLQPKIARPVEQGFIQVQSFLRRGHNPDGTLSAIQNWTDIPFRSSNFTFSGTGSWGVTQANIANLMYRRVARALMMRGAITLTNVTAPLGTDLRVGLPEDFVWNTFGVGYLLYNDAGGANVVGVATTPVGERFVTLQKIDFSNWTATAGNNTTVYFYIDGDIR
jgi:hypothetical protein